MTLNICVPVAKALEKTCILGMDFVCPKWQQSLCKVLTFSSVLNNSATNRQALVNVPNIKFHNNLSHGRQTVSCRQAGRQIRRKASCYLSQGGAHLKKYSIGHSEFWAVTENEC